MISTLIITSTTLRHKYFAIKILKEIPDSKVIFEKRNRKKYYQVENSNIMDIHFEKLFKAEEKAFKSFVKENAEILNSRLLRVIEPGEINLKESIDYLYSLKPNSIALYSVSILRDDIIKRFRGKLFNVHAGLSPYYRGTATNIWPIINKELEYIGMTIHHIDKGIDSGGLILQDRPNLVPKDDSHTMACKNTKLVTDMMIKVIRQNNIFGKLPNIKQDLSIGKQYFFKDFTTNTVLELNRLLEDDIVLEYINNRRSVELIQW